MDAVSAPRYLTIEELAQRSGWSLSTLRRGVRDGQIPVIQPGGPRTRMAFDPDVLDRLVARRAEPAREPEKKPATTPAANGTHDAQDSADPNAVAEEDPHESKDNTEPLSGPVPAWMSGDLFRRINPTRFAK